MGKEEHRKALDYLFFACLVFVLGTGLALGMIVLDGDPAKGTISQMVYDWNKPPGIVFHASATWTAVLLISSGYPYHLPNVRIDTSNLDDCNRIGEKLRLISMLGFWYVAAVPVQLQAWVHLQLTSAHSPTGMMALHCLAGACAPGCFLVAEVSVMCKSKMLSDHERFWRTIACAAMGISGLFFVLNHVLTELGSNKDLFERWTLCFELAIGSGFVWAIQLIWNFSEGQTPRSLLWHNLCPWPYLVWMFVIASDGYKQPLRFVGEIAPFLLTMWGFFHLMRIQASAAGPCAACPCKQRGLGDHASSNYGSTSDEPSAQMC